MGGEEATEEVSESRESERRESASVEETLTIYETAFESYRSSDRTLVYELYLGIVIMSILANLIEQRDVSSVVRLSTLSFGLFTLLLLYYSAWTLERVKHLASSTMKEIEEQHFAEDAPTWQTRLDTEITHTAESGDRLGWFRFLPEDALLNTLVPTGWVGIHLLLVLVWTLYSGYKLL